MPGTIRWRDDRQQWMVDIYVGGRRIRRFVGAGKELAEAALRKWQDDKVRVANGLPAWIANVAPTLREYVPHYLNALKDAGRAPRTLELRTRHLDTIAAQLGDMPLNLIRRAQVQAFVRSRLAAGLSSSTVHAEAMVLRNLLRTAAAAELIPPPENLGPLPPMRTRTRFLSLEEVGQLLPALAEDVALDRLARITLWSGLRISEALGLRWRDVDRRAGVLRIAKAKGGKPAVAPLHPTLAARLTPQRGEEPSGWVIPRPHPTIEEARHTLSQRLRRVAARAGIPGCHHHVLRHTFEAHLSMSGADAGALRDALRHRSIATTNAYVHTVPAHVRAAVGRLPWADRAPGGHQRPKANRQASRRQ